MRNQRKRELYDLVHHLAKGYSAPDIAVLLGITAAYVRMIAADLGITCQPAPPDQRLERMDPATARRCSLFRVSRAVAETENEVQAGITGMA